MNGNGTPGKGNGTPQLGMGIGWRPEIADAIEGLSGVDWVEAVAENICPGHLPDALVRLRERGVTVVPHGVSLGLGGADRPDVQRLADLAARAEALGAPLVTEHIAFVRAGGALTASPVLEAGHLLPVPRTWDALRVLCENVRIAQDALPVPLAVENIAALISWPGEELSEGQFLAELVERTGIRLLIDVANLHTNHVNRGEDPVKALDELPVEAIAYVHVAGGLERDGVWHDTHAHPVTKPVLDILAELRARVAPPGVLLERDDDFPPAAELAGELTAIRETIAAGPATAGGDRRRPAAAGASVPEAPVQGGASAEGDARHLAGEPAQRHAVAGASAPKAHAPGSGPAKGDARRLAGGTAQRHAVAGPSVPGTPARGSASAEGDAQHLVGGTAQRHAVAGAPVAESPDPGSGPAEGGAAYGRRTLAGPVREVREAPRSVEAAGDGVRARVALEQAALLSALVAGTPAPEGFDARRLGVQSRALAAKRAGVVAKLAPELPEILGGGYRAAFLAYAQIRPLRGGYRRDALDFAEHLLIDGRPEDAAARRRLTLWWKDRAAPRPPRRATRLVRAATRAAARAVLVRK